MSESRRARSSVSRVFQSGQIGRISHARRRHDSRSSHRSSASAKFLRPPAIRGIRAHLCRERRGQGLALQPIFRPSRARRRFRARRRCSRRRTRRVFGPLRWSARLLRRLHRQAPRPNASAPGARPPRALRLRARAGPRVAARSPFSPAPSKAKSCLLLEAWADSVTIPFSSSALPANPSRNSPPPTKISIAIARKPSAAWPNSWPPHLCYSLPLSFTKAPP